MGSAVDSALNFENYSFRTMFNKGPWKWIVCVLLVVSASGNAFTEVSDIILDYNLVVGIENDLFGYEDKVDKITFMRYSSYAKIVGPLAAGFMIDLF